MYAGKREKEERKERREEGRKEGRERVCLMKREIMVERIFTTNGD